MPWPEAQQQPSGNGLRLFFARASCSLCHRLQGLDSNLPSFFPPSVLPCSSLFALCQAPPHRTVGLRRYQRTACVNFSCGHPAYTCTVLNTHRDFFFFDQTTDRASCCSQQGIVPRAPQRLSRADTPTCHHSTRTCSPLGLKDMMLSICGSSHFRYLPQKEKH